MIRLKVLVEGQTEELFIRNVLAPYLLAFNIFCEPIPIVTGVHPSGKKHVGGVTSWGKVKNNLNNVLADKTAFVSTMLDFYRFPSDIPNYPPANSGSALQRAAAIQVAMQHCFAYAKPRLIPFLALHEFEALLFSSPAIIATHFRDTQPAQTQLIETLSQLGNPEDINHGDTTHPAARLTALGRYGKVRDGVTLAKKIGIQAMLEKCPHFAAWVSQLCALANNKA